MMTAKQKAKLKKAPPKSIAVFGVDGVDTSPLMDIIKAHSKAFYEKVMPYEGVSRLLKEEEDAKTAADEFASRAFEAFEKRVLLPLDAPSDSEVKSEVEVEEVSSSAALRKSTGMIMMVVIDDTLDDQLNTLQEIRKQLSGIPCSLAFYHKPAEVVKPQQGKQDAVPRIRPKLPARQEKEIREAQAARFAAMGVMESQVCFTRKNATYNLLPFLRGVEKRNPHQSNLDSHASCSQFFGPRTKIVLSGAVMGLTGAGLYLLTVEAALSTTLIALSSGTAGGALGFLLLYLLAKTAYNCCCAPQPAQGRYLSIQSTKLTPQSTQLG